jgi:hypothetical protein
MGMTNSNRNEVIDIDVNGNILRVTPNMTANELIRVMGEDPQSMTLMQTMSDGTCIQVPGNNRISATNGSRFNSILSQTGGKK